MGFDGATPHAHCRETDGFAPGWLRLAGLGTWGMADTIGRIIPRGEIWSFGLRCFSRSEISISKWSSRANSQSLLVPIRAAALCLLLVRSSNRAASLRPVSSLQCWLVPRLRAVETSPLEPAPCSPVPRLERAEEPSLRLSSGTAEFCQ